MWSLINRLTGATPPAVLTDRDMRRIDISHLWREYPSLSAELCWMFVNADGLKSHGYDKTQDEQLFLDLPLCSIHFQSDHNRSGKQSTDMRKRRREPHGQLDPSFDPTLADVYHVSHRMALVPSEGARWHNGGARSAFRVGCAAVDAGGGGCGGGGAGGSGGGGGCSGGLLRTGSAGEAASGVGGGDGGAAAGLDARLGAGRHAGGGGALAG